MEKQRRQDYLLKRKYWRGWKPTWNIVNIAVLIIAILENRFVKTTEPVNNTAYQWFLWIYLIYLLIVYGFGAFKRSHIHLHYYAGHFAPLNTVLGIVLIFQDLVTEKLQLLHLPFFVSFAQILDQMRADVQILWESTLSSFGLWLISFVVGTLLGVFLGIMMGHYKRFNYWAFPFLKVIGIIPPVALMPIVLVVFPTNYLAEIFLIVFAVWFPVAFMTINGVQGISSHYFESAKTLGFSEGQIIRKVIIPGSMPSIFNGMYTSMGLSFTMLVISEMMGAKIGLGWYINYAKSVGNYPQVYAAIVIMAILFSVIFALVNKLHDRVLSWNDSNE
ncbi:ABC transporter permease [uncultured bacterium]|uniref:ABC transporter permease n=1 Tax=Acetilactobacillus jinshanensis TaxID=1720083 RepID=A0A4P6ZMH8_9LACO|nr:ABC transporter permease [Acetilactobacillus jinshanensis]URL61914.1 ABC transporter permease [uncultured bacterium]